MKALRWLGIEYAKTFGFCIMVAAIIGFFMTFIAYPVQVITAAIIILALFVAGSVFFGK